jgi:periplasmic copper chaperone A
MNLTSHFRAAALFALAAFATATHAHDYKVGGLKIDHPWTRATPGGAKVGGGFMKITNTGTETDRLIGGSAEIAKAFEVHEMKMEGSTMMMRALDKGLEIKPGETVELKPGGFHVMFLDLQAPIKDGEKLKGQLVFEKAGKVEVEYKVEPRGTASPSGHDAHHGHDAHGKKAP